MEKAVFWCGHCEIPVIGNEICPLCSSRGKLISSNGICNPVFLQEKKLLSLILGRDFRDTNIWYLGSSSYWVAGKRVKLPYVEFYKEKKHLAVAEDLRNQIVSDDVIPNQEKYFAANERYLKELIYEAEAYVADLLGSLGGNADKRYVPTVSFSGGKDSTVVSRIVRDALQDESVIHYFGDTTLEFPHTYEYVEKRFRSENPFTPMVPSETDNDFFKLCNVFGWQQLNIFRDSSQRVSRAAKL